MKKILLYLLALIMIFTFSSCNNISNIRGTYENDASNTAVSSNASDEASKEFSLGKVDGTVYKNDFIGLGYTLDEGWSFYGDEAIRALNNFTTEVAGEEYQKMMENADVVVDMYAGADELYDNVNINLEKLNTFQALTLDISDNYKKLLPELVTTMENMGCTDVKYEVSTVEVDGKTVEAIYGIAKLYGMDMYQVAFAKKCNGYLANVTVTTCLEDTTAQLIDNFFWLD